MRVGPIQSKPPLPPDRDAQQQARSEEQHHADKQQAEDDDRQEKARESSPPPQEGFTREAYRLLHEGRFRAAEELYGRIAYHETVVSKAEEQDAQGESDEPPAGTRAPYQHLSSKYQKHVDPSDTKQGNMDLRM